MGTAGGAGGLSTHKGALRWLLEDDTREISGVSIVAGDTPTRRICQFGSVGRSLEASKAKNR
jgi:hypothetical protein